MKTEQLKTRISEFIFSGNDPFIITDEIVSFIEANFKLKREPVNKELVQETSQWISKWLEIFPNGVRSGGKLLRSDPKKCLEKMVKFRADYPEYSVEDIFKATQHYINNKSQEEYAYTTCAVNFIQHREKGSELAATCGELVFDKNVSESSVKHNFQSAYYI